MYQVTIRYHEGDTVVGIVDEIPECLEYNDTRLWVRPGSGVDIIIRKL